MGREDATMSDALRHARRLRQCALKALKLAQDSPSREVARRYRLISRHYAALARLAESGKHVERAGKRSHARDGVQAIS
jgi:hypothetical protein